MNVKHYFWILLLTIFVSGCATTQPVSQNGQMQIKMAQLERKIDARNEDIESLKMRIADLENEIEDVTSYEIEEPDIKRYPSAIKSLKTGKSTSSGFKNSDPKIIRVAVSAEKVQEALKAAGYYQGAIDGKIGGGSQKAIVEFQDDHDLKTDGIVGKQTWGELKTYLE